MKIYTKTGDKGETSLIGAKRYKKNDEVFHLLGALDELNACLGVCAVENLEEVRIEILKIQSDLLHIGSVIAGAKNSEETLQKISTKVPNLEKLIDHFTEQMCSLTNFILPGGSMQSANLHFARAFCRRAERHAVDTNCQEEILSYLNRLSDLLFTLARYVNYKQNIPDLVWNSHE